jgi:hypothetical protein
MASRYSNQRSRETGFSVTCLQSGIAGPQCLQNMARITRGKAGGKAGQTDSVSEIDVRNAP